ncbi:MAG: phosphoribosylglycinamide formyltransferase [Cytophagales bacterium]|nr:phosphoribosylglycinamide formyltransferase [Armatimonadota bacterium]
MGKAGSDSPSGDKELLALAVFVGTKGRGSNLFALRDAIEAGRLAASIAVVIGTRAEAPALVRARAAGLSVRIVDPQTIHPEEYGAALLATLKDAGTDTIALAGFLRRVPPLVVQAFPHRIVNIHPSLLPLFGGKGMYGEHVHRAVLEYGVKVSGCTVHFVDEAYDTGPIIAQRSVPVWDTDTPETLAARILPLEHALLAESLQLLAEGRLTLNGRVVRVLTDAAAGGTESRMP